MQRRFPRRREGAGDSFSWTSGEFDFDVFLPLRGLYGSSGLRSFSSYPRQSRWGQKRCWRCISAVFRAALQPCVHTRAIDPSRDRFYKYISLKYAETAVARCHSLPSRPQVAVYFLVARKRGAANLWRPCTAFNIAANVCLADDFLRHARRLVTICSFPSYIPPCLHVLCLFFLFSVFLPLSSSSPMSLFVSLSRLDRSVDLSTHFRACTIVQVVNYQCL